MMHMMTNKKSLHKKNFSLNIARVLEKGAHTRKNSDNEVFNFHENHPLNRLYSKNCDLPAPCKRTASEKHFPSTSRSSSKDNKLSIKRELSPDEQDQVEKLIKQRLSVKYDSIKTSVARKISVGNQQMFGDDFNMIRADSLAAVQAGKMEKQILPTLKREAISEVLLNRKLNCIKPRRDLILSEMENIIINKHEFVPTKLFTDKDQDFGKAGEEAQKSFKVYGVKPIKPV